MSSAEFGNFIASETAKWGRVVKEGGHQGAVTVTRTANLTRVDTAPGSRSRIPARRGLVTRSLGFAIARRMTAASLLGRQHEGLGAAFGHLRIDEAEADVGQLHFAPGTRRARDLPSSASARPWTRCSSVSSADVQDVGDRAQPDEVPRVVTNHVAEHQLGRHDRGHQIGLKHLGLEREVIEAAAGRRCPRNRCKRSDPDNAREYPTAGRGMRRSATS